MKKYFLLFFFLLIWSLPLYAKEKLLVVTTLPDLKSIAEEVGGDKVEVVSLAKGYQDPHYVSPTLKLMSIVNRADLYIEIGLELELWSERVIDGARNPGIRVGQKGHVYASQGVHLKEVPKVLSRAEGDLHPYGNPHIWVDPLNAKIMAQNILEGLKRISPGDGPYFEKRKKALDRKITEAMYAKKLVSLFGPTLLDRMQEKGRLFSFLEKKKLSPSLQKRLGVEKLIDLLGGWMGTARKFRGKKIVFFHQSWIYFADRFGLEITAYVEGKPGISPSQAHRASVEKKIKEENIKVIAITNYYDDTIPKILASNTGARVVVVPSMTGGIKGTDDYISFMNHLVNSIAKAYEEAK